MSRYIHYILIIIIMDFFFNANHFETVSALQKEDDSKREGCRGEWGWGWRQIRKVNTHGRIEIIRTSPHHANINISIYTHTNTHTHARTHAHAHIHIHTYSHTHTPHTHKIQDSRKLYYVKHEKFKSGINTEHFRQDKVMH